jgi:hypothetical protein
MNVIASQCPFQTTTETFPLKCGKEASFLKGSPRLTLQRGFATEAINKAGTLRCAERASEFGLNRSTRKVLNLQPSILAPAVDRSNGPAFALYLHPQPPRQWAYDFGQRRSRSSGQPSHSILAPIKLTNLTNPNPRPNKRGAL